MKTTLIDWIKISIGTFRFFFLFCLSFYRFAQCETKDMNNVRSCQQTTLCAYFRTDSGLTCDSRRTDRELNNPAAAPSENSIPARIPHYTEVLFSDLHPGREAIEFFLGHTSFFLCRGRNFCGSLRVTSSNCCVCILRVLSRHRLRITANV